MDKQKGRSIMAKFQENAGKFFHSFFHSLKTWEWTKRLVYWTVISAGTMSEWVFLVASLWVSINANVHSFVLLLIPDGVTRHITELATAAYVALPECIVGLACVVTISHIRMIMYNHRDYRSIIWAVLYGMPTLVFLVLSVFTLGNAVASVDFRMPVVFVVIRAIAGYWFAFTSLLYMQLGTPQERDRLQEKDDKIASGIAELRRLNDLLQVTIDRMKAEYQAEIARLNA